MRTMLTMVMMMLGLMLWAGTVLSDRLSRSLPCPRLRPPSHIRMQYRAPLCALLHCRRVSPLIMVEEQHFSTASHILPSSKCGSTTITTRAKCGPVHSSAINTEMKLTNTKIWLQPSARKCKIQNRSAVQLQWSVRWVLCNGSIVYCSSTLGSPFHLLPPRTIQAAGGNTFF